MTESIPTCEPSSDRMTSGKPGPSAARSEHPAARLANFPISFFAVVMGLCGLVIATQKIEELLVVGNLTSTVILGVTLLVFLILSALYALKLLRQGSTCAREFGDPIKLGFFPTFSIGLLLVSVAFLPLSKTVSMVFWIVGTVLHLALTLAVLSIWVQQQKFEIKHMSPVWFIPVVGNMLVPVSGVAHAPQEVSWFFFSMGVVFWMILQTLFFYRIFFHHPLAEKLLPTFFILLAPPTVGFVAYLRLTGSIDNFAYMLYYLGLFLFLFLLVQMPMLHRPRFYLSWWAYSFPIAALSIASAVMYHHSDVRFFSMVAFVVFAVLVLLILALAVLTIKAMIKQGICVEE